MTIDGEINIIDGHLPMFEPCRHNKYIFLYIMEILERFHAVLAFILSQCCHPRLERIFYTKFPLSPKRVSFIPIANPADFSMARSSGVLQLTILITLPLDVGIPNRLLCP